MRDKTPTDRVSQMIESVERRAESRGLDKDHSAFFAIASARHAWANGQEKAALAFITEANAHIDTTG